MAGTRPSKPRGYENYLTVSELMERLGLPWSQTLLKHIHSGELQAERLPNRGKNTPYLIPPEAAEDYIQRWYTPVPVPPRG
jgi:hypothetical protein